MSKTIGGVRNLAPNSQAYKNRVTEAARMRASGKYSSVTMAENGTGYVAIESSPAKHKPEEIEAAMHLGNNGYKVILGNEAGEGKCKEGKLFLSTFEQKTPDGKHNDAKNIKNALGHARDKKADIAVIYMKYGTHSRKTVEEGIKNFEKSSKYRFQKIIIITKDGRLHHHHHDT